MKGLLIAYTFAPEKSVGALRPTYWAEEIANNSSIVLDVITASPADETELPYNRIYVPNTATSVWSTFIKDEGLTWRKNLREYFDRNSTEQYDFVLITGGPFFHFSIGTYLKKKGLKVIYDYRDPFSYNPRFNERGLKRVIKEQFERKFLKSADLVLTVNDACHQYIGNGMKLNRGIIPNGYDERAIDSNLTDATIECDFFYGGKFYWEPSVLFEVMVDENYTLHHAGNVQNYAHEFVKSDLYKYLGLLSQKELYSELAKAEIGLVFTMNVPFESTTKIYDYMALGKKILVITRGEPNVGVLNRELEKYPMHRWVRYDAHEIKQAIRELKSMKNVPVNTDQFSRRCGLQNLIVEINTLVNE